MPNVDCSVPLVVVTTSSNKDQKQATEAADSHAAELAGTVPTPKAADVKVNQKAAKDKVKQKAAKAKQKADNFKKKIENSRLHDQPLILKGRTFLPLQIRQLDPFDLNPTPILFLLQVSKPLLDARGRPRHIRNNRNYRMLPSLCHPYTVWKKSVVKPWDSEFCSVPY